MSNKIKFILNTSVEYFTISETNVDDLPIREFLENDDITILSALNRSDKLVFLHNVPADENCVIFYKIPQIGNKQQPGDVPLGIMTLEGGLTKSIYNSVSRVFSPQVTKKIEYSPELEILIENLHATLGSSLGLPKTSTYSVQQEIIYWNEKSSNSPTKSDKETAKIFVISLEKLNALLRDVGSISSLEEFLDSIHSTLDEIWRLPTNYPQNRMVDLLDIISANVLEFCSDHLSIEDVWNLKSFEVSQTLRDILEIVESWIQVCDSLTRLFWPNYAQHAWMGDPHIPKNSVLFQERLNEIKNIKNVYKDITCLFNENNQIDKSIRRIFIPFKEINIFDITPIGTKKWRRAVLQYEHILEPINEKISLVLKSKLHHCSNDPRGVIQIFLKFGSVVKRPDIMEQLGAEREHFLESLDLLVTELKSFLSENHKCPDDIEISPICWETKGLKNFQNELDEISNICYLIKDIDGYDKVRLALDSLKEETEKWLQSNFDAWRQQSISSVGTGDLTLRDEKPVVEFEKEGRQLMMVTFKPKLVTFCSDIREFESMGYRIPIELRNTGMHAIKFMGYARKLQQIANFHNTIGDRMIVCLRPIMLKNALELSKLVRSESVAWNDEESVDRYVSTLQYSVNNLSRDNSILTEYHEKTKAIIIKLITTDLLRQGDVWKEEMKNLRNIIAHLETKGYSNLNGFKIHWDHQLYKILEYQYLTGLLDINQKLPDIYIDIVFRQQEIQFRPTMEEIRQTYFAQLRRFIERPIAFKGLSPQTSIFKHMVDINRHQFSSLYEKGQELFKKLCEFRNLWRPFVSLGCVNLEELCEVHLKSREDWDKNFKACKYFSQQIAKITNAENRIDCFVINTSPIRSDIEFISRKYWETLTYSLRSSILKDITELQDFLNTSSKVMQTAPAMDDLDLDEAGGQYERIITELPNMAELLKTVESKDSCLAGWCRERVSALGNIQTQWEQLQPLIDNHSATLKMQADIVRNQIEFQLSNLKDETEKFQIRWESTIADLENNDESNLALFKERLQNWSTITQQKYKLERSCAKYSVEFPTDISELFTKLTEDVSRMGYQWELFEQFLNEYHTISMEEWTVYRRRPYILTDFTSKWQNSINTQSNKASKKIQQILDGYQSAMPTLQSLQADGLTERHWANIFHILKLPYKAYHDIKLQDVLGNVHGLIEHAADVQQLVRKASSEQIIRQALAELDQWGTSAVLKTATHADSIGVDVCIIKDFQDILNKIGDNQCLLQSAKNSAAFESYSDQAEIWESRLASLDHILSCLNQIQRKWIYLEPIFGTENLIAEGTTFKQINKDFRYIMKEISNDARVLSLVKIHSITSIIDSLENQLSRCQNTLTTFINTKRNAFPRFYFLSNDDLLEFLGQSSKDHIIQKHIKKLFPGVHELGCVTNGKTIQVTCLRSAEGEEIELNTAIDVSGPIEKWLNSLLIEIKATMKDLVTKCCQFEKLTDEVIISYPAQVLYLANSIQFTKKTEKAITSAMLQKHLKSIKEEIEFYTTNFGKADNLTQTKVRGVLLDLVHHVSIVQQLIDDGVTSTQDWGWMQQIRFYLHASNNLVTVRMVYAEFEYSYEYLGNFNKLVDTKLTHNCYLTLTQAMLLGLGGNPFGPAGTGKTECVKSLGAMLGRLVLVFNCSENVDTTAIGLILAGLARCGAWGCFDEFNRLQEATLSVLSMLIQPIQTALQKKSSTVNILNDEIPLNLHCGIFVTLNPAGEEYGGRQTLPANLQALFRPIVMQRPEPKEIARVMLFVEGFKQADAIGARMVELFKMAGKILSPQRHYEWGLRELKTVLLACGSLLKIEGPLMEVNQEMELAVRALRSNTMSKLNSSDCERFDMLINYVFADTKIEVARNDDLRIAIQQAFVSLNLQLNDKQLEKCLQLQEQLEKRMGVVILGPPGCGKTSILAVLKQALINASHNIKSYTIAPKSMDRVQLLGRLDPDTRQWQDGVLTTTAVTVNNEPSDIKSWIICDGDVDPDWIEALNSVLDDNKLLTLPSGWRIQFGDNVNFIFETHDLRHASPATISRMGIVTLSAEDLPESILMDTWTENPIHTDTTGSFVLKYMPKAMSWIKNKHNLITSGFVLNGLQNLTGAANKEEFSVRLIYGMGFALKPDIQTDFATAVFEWTDVYIPNGEDAKFCFYNKHRNSVEMFKSDEVGLSAAKEFKIDRLIQTAKMKTYANVLNSLLEQSVPFIMVGPSGSGKSLLLQNIVGDLSAHELVTIKCSAQLTASYVLYVLKQNSLVISGNRGREYRPKYSNTIVYFKNIDLCPVDEWGTSEVIELILQLIQRNGFYADTLEWISATGLKICSSMSDSPKQILSPRFLCLIQNIYTEYPSDDELHLIVKDQLIPVYNRFKKHLGNIYVDQIVDALIEIYSQIKKEFTRDIRNHYIFTPKMLTNLISGLVYYPEDRFQEAFCTEAINIFRNRLVTERQKQQFNEMLRAVCAHVFDIDGSNYFFTPIGPLNSSLKYVLQNEWTDAVERSITICCTEDILMETVIGPELLESTASICRALSRESTHLILVGMIGCGKMESLHIACNVLNVKLVTVLPVKNYDIEDFYADIKIAMQAAALEDQHVVFHIDHPWISYLPTILNPVEAILEGSEVSDLFGDDLESIAKPLKNAAQQEGYQESLVAYFWSEVKAKLHIVISFESQSKSIDDFFTKYPALYRSTEMLWISRQTDIISEKGSEAIIKSISKNKSDETPIPKYMLSNKMEQSVWKSSPYRFKNLIISYYHLYNNMLSKTRSQQKILQAGVDKLSAAQQVVQTLKIEAKEQEIALADKRQMANNALDLITSTMRNANDQKTDLLELKKTTQESSVLLKHRQAAVELELQEVEPLLQEAVAAVGQIKSEALSEIRSLRAPPDIIRDILEGVLRLMGTRDTSWNSMKSFLAKRGVKEDIRSLNPARISPESCNAVEKLLHNKAESFDVKNAKRASAAAAPLAAWVIANVKYCKVIQSVKPLEDEQKMLQQNLIESENNMKMLQSGLNDVDAKVKTLSEQLNLYTQEAAVLEIKLQDARNTLKSSEVLVSKLSTEYENWEQQLDDINSDIKKMDVNAFTISFCVSHLSYMTYEERIFSLEQMAEELNLASLDVSKKLLTDENRIIWENMGLTSDIQSMENAAILTKILSIPFGSTPIPLLNDPSKGAIAWLPNYLKSLDIAYEITTQSAERFTYNLELAVRFGKVLIVNDCNVIRPPLLSIIECKVHSRFNKKLLQVGNKLVDFHENFKLILCTMSVTEILDNIDVIGAYITIIPFTTTVAGLTDQLMSKSILVKQPEMETKRINLLQTESKLWKDRQELNQKLLCELSNSQGDILKNEKLLQTLNEVKASSTKIDASLRESNEIKQKLMLEYDQFRDICNRAAKLFIGINQNYNLSVAVFTTLYVKSIKVNEDFHPKATYEQLVRLTYNMLSRSISKADHITLGLQIFRKAYPDQIPEKEWESFVTNFISGDDASSQHIPNWIPKAAIPKVLSLQINHPEFYEQLKLDNENQWSSFITDASPPDVPVQVSEFRKILITQILRSDHLIPTLTKTLSKLLDTSIPSEAKPSIQQLLDESHEDEPIVFITTGEIDPAKDIQDYAQLKHSRQNYAEVAIGKGQEQIVTQQIQKSGENGHWICVKNVQLVPEWLAGLNEKLQSMNLTSGFRLWLICDSSKHFPPSLLAKCKTVLYEPPNSVKSKVLRLIQQWNSVIETKKDSKIVKLYIAIFLFNAVLQERRSYIPQGWSNWYEFADSDLKAAIDIIGWMEQALSIKMDWAILRKLINSIAYGGRISNPQDLQILTTNLDEFFDGKLMTNSWSPLQFNVSIPLSQRAQDYCNILAKFPDVDKPEVFGLSSSTLLMKETILCKNILKTLRNSEDLFEGHNSFEKRLKPILNLWKKLNEGVHLVQSTEDDEQTVHITDSWTAFIYSELILGKKMFKTIHQTLVEMRMATKDITSIGKNDMALIKIVCENQVPLKWRQLWSGPKILTDYLKAAVCRGIEANNRFNSERNIEFGDKIDLAKVYNVESFLAALKLRNARELQVSTCDLHMISSLAGPITSVKTATPSVAPLLINGASWRGNHVVLNSTESKQSSMTSAFSITFNVKTIGDDINCVKLPLYSNSTRNCQICELVVQTSATKQAVILSGAAFIVPDF